MLLVDNSRCRTCVYQRSYKYSTGFICVHPQCEASAKAYEERKNVRINKIVNFIGRKILKTTLRWCPLKNKDI